MDFSTMLRACGLADEPCLLDLWPLFQQWWTFPDPRHARGKRYALGAMLSIATLAKLAGCQCPQAIADWARLRAHELCALFRLGHHRMPTLRTWDRVFAHSIDLAQLERIVYRFVGTALKARPARGSWCAALDGKTLRGSIRRGKSGGVHVLAIYLPAQGVVLAQLEIGAKANEISAAPQLLAQVDLHGLIVTGDAMFAQRRLSLQIRQASGDYLWQVKDNQPALLESIETLFNSPPTPPGRGQLADDFETAHTLDKGHGRLDQRTLMVSSLLQEYSDWPHLAQVFRLERQSLDLATGKVTTHVRYGVTSLPHELADAARLLALVREHWGIESDLHYRRDVTLGEDKARVCVGRAPYVHATLNNLVLVLLDRCGDHNVARAQRTISYRLARLLASLILT
jgi:predicted transposase YbfD/YdcC